MDEAPENALPSVRNGDVVPEPPRVLLLATGLTGLTGLARTRSAQPLFNGRPSIIRWALFLFRGLSQQDMSPARSGYQVYNDWHIIIRVRHSGCLTQINDL